MSLGARARTRLHRPRAGDSYADVSAPTAPLILDQSDPDPDFRHPQVAYNAYAPPARHGSHIPQLDYGYELVLVYGFFFSMLIAAVYLPTHLSFARIGGQIRDSCFPDVPPSAADWQDRTAKREALGNVLELQAGPFSQFKASAAILTPFAASLVGLLLK